MNDVLQHFQTKVSSHCSKRSPTMCQMELNNSSWRFAFIENCLYSSLSNCRNNLNRIVQTRPELTGTAHTQLEPIQPEAPKPTYRPDGSEPGADRYGFPYQPWASASPWIRRGWALSKTRNLFESWTRLVMVDFAWSIYDGLTVLQLSNHVLSKTWPKWVSLFSLSDHDITTVTWPILFDAEYFTERTYSIYFSMCWSGNVGMTASVIVTLLAIAADC